MAAKKKSTADTTTTNLPAVRRVGPPPLKVGRPSIYHPGMCEEVVRLGADGYSPAQIAAHYSVTRTTLYHWADQYPEFLTALKIAKEYEQAWWELAGREGMYSDKFNAAIWRKSMEARFRQDYTEPKQDQAQVVIEQPKRINVMMLEPEKREQLRQLLLEARENAAADEEAN
jgi:Helix-turn-helix domain of resolvase